MRDTGIVRRIDELGRVVIPKEIRKTLRIREGDPLEIYTEKDQLLFKKYSPLTTLSAYGETMIKTLSTLTEKVCVLTDTDRVLYVAGGKIDAVGKNISSSLETAYKDRKTLNLSKTDGDNILPLFKGDEIATQNQIISPIIGGGDCYGGIIMFDKEQSLKLTPCDQKLCILASTFLGKQFE